jgi:glyoxylase-like metal-dependent hydrolase (beta-lactamase superfamily II)
LLAAALGGVAGLVFATRSRLASAQARDAASAGTPVVERLGEGLFLIAVPGECNVVAQVSTAGVLLVDGVSAAAAKTLQSAVAALPGSGPVHTLFNTHWHPEQVGSNAVVGAAGRTIIAHENTRLWLTTDVTWPWSGQRVNRLPRVAQPNKTFYTTGRLETGVRYGHIPEAAHTDGDLYVHFPEANVLVVGDVVSGRGWPVVDYTTGGWIGGMLGGLQRLQTLVDSTTKVVPARGPVLGASDLKVQADMYGTLYERLTQLLNKGRGPQEAVDARPAREFEARLGNPDEFVRRAFESLWGYLSPDA